MPIIKICILLDWDYLDPNSDRFCTLKIVQLFNISQVFFHYKIEGIIIICTAYL